jgi:hypothetical protein
LNEKSWATLGLRHHPREHAEVFQRNFFGH